MNYFLFYIKTNEQYWEMCQIHDFDEMKCITDTELSVQICMRPEKLGVGYPRYYPLTLQFPKERRLAISKLSQ